MAGTKSKRCDGGVMFVKFEGGVRATKRMAKNIGIEVSSRLLAMLSRSFELILTECLEEGETLDFTYGEVKHNGLRATEMFLDVSYWWEDPESPTRRGGGPILRIDLLKRRFIRYRSQGSSQSTLTAIRDGERYELENQIVQTVNSLMSALPWVDSELSGDILGRKTSS